MADKNIDNNDIDSSNIFDDFLDDKSLVDEVNKIKMANNKDLYFYLSKWARFFQVFFWIWLLVIWTLFWYITIQNKADFKASKLLTPFCSIFLWDIERTSTLCSSISSLKELYITQLSDLKNENTQDILVLIEDIYKIKYFTKSKEVLFLLDKSDSKGSILSVIEEFDNLKNDFYKFDKQKIQCDSLVIDSSKKILSMSCIAFSAWYEKNIRWFNWWTDDTVKWTSISIANSFLNYIDVKSNIFNITDRQKIFKSENIVWEKTDFTNKTTFSLKLKYNLQ